jgi:hypothetical protein
MPVDVSAVCRPALGVAPVADRICYRTIRFVARGDDSTSTVSQSVHFEMWGPDG